MKIRRSDRNPGWRAVAFAVLGAALAILSLPALSVAPGDAASQGLPGTSAPEVANPADTAPSAKPPAAAATTENPAADAQDRAKTATPAAPIALVLPLESKLYARAADAVRAGFAAAAASAGVRYDVYPHGDGDVAAAFDKAKAAGARVIVGPLVRDDLKTIAAAAADDLPWTIALNQLDEGVALPPKVYTLALAVDSEGVQLARRALADGAKSVVIVASDNALHKRFAGAFVGEWILGGGGAPTTFRFDSAPDMLALLRREAARSAPDAVVLALDARDAALAKPYLPPVPVYASSQVNDAMPRESRRDLEDVRFVELPWLADPAGAAYAGIPHRDYGNPTLERLYALGIDAARVAQAFVDGAPASLAFDGATGHVELGTARQFVREATVLQFRDGDAVVAGAR